MINWKVRIKNKYFWVAFVPALALVVQSICKLFGLVIDLTEVQTNFLEIINSLFALLSLLGIVVDPTTAGISDSYLAMTYEEPKDDK